MARQTVAIVFHVDCSKVDEIIEQIRHNPDIELIHVQQSYSKLWIMKGEPNETNR